jgi:dTDP-glucose pyrophosphorylase
MSLSQQEKNKIYDVLFNRMLRPSTPNESEITRIVEGVVGKDKDIDVLIESESVSVTIQDTNDVFTVEMLTDKSITEGTFLQD